MIAFDYAVLILDTDLNLEEYFGSFSYDFDWQTKLSLKDGDVLKSLKHGDVLKNLKLIGYHQSEDKPQLSLDKCSSISDTNHMVYSIKTSQKSRGSPLLLRLQKNKLYLVIGIHSLNADDFAIGKADKI